MKFKDFVLIIFGITIILLASSAVIAEETHLNGLMKGRYGFTENIICIQPAADESGLHPALPHFIEVQPGVYQLQVAGVSSSIVLSGVSEFDGEGTMQQTGHAMSINTSAINAGDMVGNPYPPMDCQSTYTVTNDRMISTEGATCTATVPGDPPMTMELGPFAYSGFLSADGNSAVLSIATPLKSMAVVKMPDGTIVDQYEGVCVSTQVLVKIDSEPVYFAQLANGGGITSEIVLTNPYAAQQIAGSVSFRDDDGNAMSVGLEGETGAVEQVDFSLPPTGSKTIKTDGLGSVQVGSAMATSGTELSGVVRFNLPGIGVSGVGESPPLTGFIVPAQNHTDGVSTGLAIHNTSEQPVTIELTLRDQDGEVVSTAMIEDLAAHGHMAKYITEIFTDVDLSDFQGVVVARSDGSMISATALELDAASGTFTTLPVKPLM